jgi:lipoprotein NlpI
MINPFVVAATVFMLCAVLPAAAGDEADCNQFDDFNLSIAGCTRLIESGRLEGENLADTYFHRAFAYQRNNDFDRAIADYSTSIALRPASPTHNLRGMIYLGKSENDRAIADFDRAIELDPNHIPPYCGRGRVLFNQGDFQSAIPSLKRCSDESHNSYSPLWLYVAERRVGQDDTAALNAKAATLLEDEWPRPLFELYLGNQSADKSLASVTASHQRCFAHFFIGEWHLLLGEDDAAVSALRAAVEACPKNERTFASAVAELRRMGK